MNALHRFSIGAEFFVIAEDAAEAQGLVGNFIDAFPNEIEEWRQGDVILQEASLDEENVEVEHA